MLFMRDPDGRVVHQNHEATIRGKSFEIFLNVEGKNQLVIFKEGDQPMWCTMYIKEQEQKNMLFLNEPTEKKNIESKMIGKRVKFFDNGRYIGEIMDKVCIPLATNPPRGYVEHDNYVIVDGDGKIHIVNPINLNKIIEYDT